MLRFLTRHLFPLCLAVLFGAIALAAQQVPDTAVIGGISSTAPAGTLATALVAILAGLATSVTGRVTSKADRAIGSADGWLRDKAGPLLPLVALGAATYLPQVLPGAVVSPEAVVNAPLAALGAVVAREALRKWVLPLFGRGKQR